VDWREEDLCDIKLFIAGKKTNINELQHLIEVKFYKKEQTLVVFYTLFRRQKNMSPYTSAYKTSSVYKFQRHIRG